MSIFSFTPVPVGAKIIGATNKPMAANFGADVSSALPGYTLGRPLLPDLAAQIPEVEASVARLQALCLRQRASGGCLVVSAGPAGESFLYHSLAVLSSRLRRRGCSTHFPCIPFSSRLLPAPKEVSIVLDAPLRRWGDEWREPGPGMVTVLAGLDRPLAAVGHRAGCRMPAPSQSFRRRIVSAADRAVAAAVSGRRTRCPKCAPLGGGGLRSAGARLRRRDRPRCGQPRTGSLRESHRLLVGSRSVSRQYRAPVDLDAGRCPPYGW